MPGSKVLYGAHWVKKPQAYANEAKKRGEEITHKHTKMTDL